MAQIAINYIFLCVFLYIKINKKKMLNFQYKKAGKWCNRWGTSPNDSVPLDIPVQKVFNGF